MNVCRVCKNPIVLPHCDSRTCNWCRACHTAKTEQGGKKP